MTSHEEKFEIIENAVQPMAIAKSESSVVLSMMEKLQARPNFDVAKLEKLIDLYNKILDQEAKKAYNIDFVAMKPNLPRVARSKQNTQTDSKYAPLEDINDEIDPILSQYGFGSSFEIISQTETSVTLVAILKHAGGYTERSGPLTMPLDDSGIKGTVNKTKPHAISSTITYLKRVTLCLLLNISTGDDKDGNGKKKEETFLTHEQAVEVDMLLRQTNADREKFLQFMKTDDVRNILSGDYRKAMNMLTEKKKRQEADTATATTTGVPNIIE